MVTLKDIAKKAGVSHSTVSRALHNHPRLSPPTCRRLQALAKKMGYRPDPALAGLAAYRSSVRLPRRYEKIAVLSHLEAPTRLPFKIQEHVEGIRSRAQELGFEPEVFKVDGDPKSQHRLSRILYYRGIRGIIILSLPQVPSGCNWKMFSVVGIGENVMPLGIPYIATDHDATVSETYLQLKQRGYRNIGYLNIEASEKRNRFRFYSAYLKCRALDGLPFAPPLFHEYGDMSRLLGWLRRGRFDALIYSDLKIFEALKGSAYKVPETLGLSGMSFPIATALASGSAAYIVDGVRIGRLAMDVLQAMIQKNQYGIPHPSDQYAISLRGGYWREGSTVRSGGQASSEPRPPRP
jgi:DNA-binding LacI/PurR family transcriptional regulator